MRKSLGLFEQRPKAELIIFWRVGQMLADFGQLLEHVRGAIDGIV